MGRHDRRNPYREWIHRFFGELFSSATADDPIRRAGFARRPDQWCRAAEWAELAIELGLDRIVIPAADRHSDKGRERGIGVVLSGHRDETFNAETDDERLTVRLEKARLRFDSESPSTRYRLVVLERTPSRSTTRICSSRFAVVPFAQPRSLSNDAGVTASAPSRCEKSKRRTGPGGLLATSLISEDCL